MVFVGLCLLLVGPTVLADKGPIVKTAFGLVKGKYQLSEPNSRKFSTFLGIPYAKPPVGEQRFSSPVEDDSFYPPHEPLQATQYKGDCAQIQIPGGDFKGSEDCLYLNVFSPEVDFTGSPGLPVLVFIHGGGYLVGSSDPSFYGPERVLDYNVVLVTFNYRLGALGFSSITHVQGIRESWPRNLGLLDQISALKWVNNHIQAFGGDPSRITIFGESSGGDCVMALMSSPRCNGLFSQSIVMSGSYNHLNPWLHSSRSIEHYTNVLAGELGCDVSVSASHTQDCVTNKTAEDILRAASMSTRYGYLNNPFKILPDPKAVYPVLPTPLDKLWKDDSSKAAFDIPMLIGGNKDEGIMSYLDFLSDESLFDQVQQNFPIQGPVLLLSTDPGVAEREESESATAKVLVKKYLEEKKFNKEAMSEIIKLFSDVHYLAPLDQSVRDLVASKTAPTYYYNYQHKGSFSLPMFYGQPSLGVSHMDEIFMIFRHEEVSKSPLGDQALQTEDDIRVSRKLLDIWVEFATTGNPTKDNSWTPVGKNEEELKFAIIDSKKLRMTYPAEFADRMKFVTNLLNIIHAQRNFDMTEHPELKRLLEEREAFAREAIKEHQYQHLADEDQEREEGSDKAEQEEDQEDYDEWVFGDYEDVDGEYEELKDDSNGDGKQGNDDVADPVEDDIKNSANAENDDLKVDMKEDEEAVGEDGVIEVNEDSEKDDLGIDGIFDLETAMKYLQDEEDKASAEVKKILEAKKREQETKDKLISDMEEERTRDEL